MTLCRITAMTYSVYGEYTESFQEIKLMLLLHYEHLNTVPYYIITGIQYKYLQMLRICTFVAIIKSIHWL